MSTITLTPSSRLDVLSCAFILADSGLSLGNDEALVGYLAGRGVTVTRHHPLWMEILVETHNLLVGRHHARESVKISNRRALVAALIIGAIAGSACLASSPAMAAELSIPLAETIGWWAMMLTILLAGVGIGWLWIEDWKERARDRQKLAERLDDPSRVHLAPRQKGGARAPEHR